MASAALVLFGILGATLWYELKANQVVQQVREQVEGIKTAYLLALAEPQNLWALRGASARLEALKQSEAVRLLATTYWRGGTYVTGEVNHLELPEGVAALPELDGFLSSVWARQSASNSVLVGLVVVVILMLTLSVAWSEWRNHKDRERRKFELALHQQLLETVERERWTFAMDLHDSVVQKLGFLQQRNRRLGTEDEDGTALLADAIRDARQLSDALAPLEQLDAPFAQRLTDLLGDFRRWSDIRLEVVTTGITELNTQPLEDHLVRMVQELLANARKHSQATVIYLAVQNLPPTVRLQYHDDGVGIASSQGSTYPRLRSLEFRTKLLQGKMSYPPPREGGLSILIEVPLEQTAHR